MDRRVSTGAGHGKPAPSTSISSRPTTSPAWIGKEAQLVFRNQIFTPPAVEWQREPGVSYTSKQYKADYRGTCFFTQSIGVLQRLDLGAYSKE